MLDSTAVFFYSINSRGNYYRGIEVLREVRVEALVGIVFLVEEGGRNARFENVLGPILRIIHIRLSRLNVSPSA